MHTAPRNIDSLFDISKLPTLPQSLIELIDACNNRDVDLQTVSGIVSRDVSISARILQLANSAFLGSRTSYTDTEQAVIYLGIDTVRNLAISVSVHEAFQAFSAPAGMSLARFWHHSLLTAVLAKSLAEMVDYPHPAEAYLAGLLHDLGKLLLGQAFGQEYHDLIGDGMIDPTSLEVLEKARLGISHSEAGGLLVGRWNLHVPIATAIERHHRDEITEPQANSLAAILFLANSLSMSPLPDFNHLGELACRMRIAPQSLASCLEAAEETVSAIAKGMGIAIERPQAAHCEDAPTDHGRTELADKIRVLSRLHGVLDNLVRAETPDRVLRVIEESLHILFNIDKCLIFIPDLDAKGFSAHGSSGNLLARQAVDFGISAEDGEDLITQYSESKNGICLLTQSVHEGQKSPGEKLFSLFAGSVLLAIALPVVEDWRGFLVTSLEAEQRNHMDDCRDDLAFFARHAAARLYLDVLNKKRAEDLAGERVKVVQQVARSIAHEINNPLAIVQNYLSILGKRLAGQPEIQKQLRNIGEEMARIGSISCQLDDLSGPPVPHATRPVDLNALVRQSLDLFEHSLFSQQEISSQLHADPRIPPIASNPEALRQILTNLLKNAGEAVAPGGTIWLRTDYIQRCTQTGTDSVRIRIEDNGPGIAPELAETLFGAGVTSKGKGHLGLGLAIVRKLVTELGGSINCSSPKQGGTCFTINLIAKSS